MPSRSHRLFLFHDVVAEYESHFSHGSRLVRIHARRDIAGMNPGKISAEEEAAVLEPGRHGDWAADWLAGAAASPGAGCGVDVFCAAQSETNPRWMVIP